MIVRRRHRRKMLGDDLARRNQRVGVFCVDRMPFVAKLGVRMARLDGNPRHLERQQIAVLRRLGLSVCGAVVNGNSLE